MIELDKVISHRFGSGEYPAPLFDFFNWGAFALPEIWGIVHGVWSIVWVSLAAFLIPVFVLAQMAAGDAMTSSSYYGAMAFGQVALGAARLWAGMHANRLYWQTFDEQRLPLFARERREFTIQQYFAKQRQWAIVSILVMLVGTVMGVLWTFSVMGEYANLTEALFSAGQDVVWIGAFLLAASYIAHRGTILMAPRRAFAYMTLSDTVHVAGEPLDVKVPIAPLNEVGSTRLFGAGVPLPGPVIPGPPTPVAPPHPPGTHAPEALFAYPLANGTLLPVLGFGTYRIEEELEAIEAIKLALDAGYRSFDTASMYGNEAAIGRALKEYGIAREEVFLTSKVWNTEQGYTSTVHAFENSLAALQTDFLDMYLIHWPIAAHLRATWRALEHLYAAGKVRAIGVCNFEIEHIEQLMAHAHIAPMVNQIELHPRFTREELVLYCWNHGILIQSWAPLIRGGVSVIPELTLIAEAHHKTEAQVALRWAIQHNFAVIPKSTTPARIVENIDIFDFELSADEMATIDGLNRNLRIGPVPADFSWHLS